MSDVSIINEDAVRAYAGKKPLQVVGACIDAQKPFGDVERAYCSQYFSEQFALIDADMALVQGESLDPVLEGLDPNEPLPAYAQERKDMYDNVNTDFAARNYDLLDEYKEAFELMKNAEKTPGKFSDSGLVDKETLKTLYDKGLAYSVMVDEVTPTSIVQAAVEHGSHKLTWDDSYLISNYAHNKMYDCGYNPDPDFHSTPEIEQDIRNKYGAVLDELKEAQAMLADKTPDGVAVYSILPYHTVNEIRNLGFEYDIKGMSAESLCDIYEMRPPEMVACAEEAGIKWDASMQARMDSWIMFCSAPESYMEPAEVMDNVIEAERIAGASNSNVFEKSVADGTFHNGSKVRLYGDGAAERLSKMGYEERSKQSFDDYLAGMRERHGTSKQAEVSVQGNRDIKNVPEFEGGSDGSEMQLN